MSEIDLFGGGTNFTLENENLVVNESLDKSSSIINDNSSSTINNDTFVGDDNGNKLSPETLRLVEVMQNEQLTATQFAREIGVKVSSMSHIINGRNNPSLDVMQRVLRRYSNLSAEWLILGLGDSPYKSSAINSMAAMSSNDEMQIDALPIIEDSLRGHKEPTILPNSEVKTNGSASTISDVDKQSSDFVAEPLNHAIDIENTVKRVVSEMLDIKFNEYIEPLLKQSVSAETSQSSSVKATSKQQISKIIVYYSDNTFEQFIS